ncbi:MAG: hypothetical protein AB7R55_14740 [Gemmatimonadales bacterium]
MADNRVVRIVLQAVDQSSKIISGAESRIVGLGNKAKAAFGELKTFLSSRLFQAAAFAGIVAGLKRSWEEADRFEASVRKLGGTAKLTGVPLEFLQRVAKDAKDAFKLSSEQSNEFAAALARLTGKADRLPETGDALRALLDVAAARGLNAEQALTAIGQAILGIDEGTDKLFDKNPSVIYQEWADRAGLAAGKLTDTEKAQALLDEVLRGGELTRGAYLQFLETAAGQAQQLANNNQDLAVKFGLATSGLRDKLYPAFTLLANILGVLVNAFQSLGLVVQYFVTDVLDGFAGLGKTLGKLLTGDFKGAFQAAKDTMQDFRENAATVTFGLKEIWKGAEQTTTGIVLEQTEKRTTARTEESEAATKLAKEQADELVKLNDELAAKLLQIDHGLTEDQAKEMVRRARILTGQSANMVDTLVDGYKLLNDYNTILAAGFDKTLTPAIKRTEITVGDLAGGLKTDIPDGSDKAKGKLKEVGATDKEIGHAKDAVLGVGEALGGAAEQGQRATEKALALASALSAAAGDPTALVGAIGSAAGLFASIFSSAAASESKKVIEANTRSIEENTRRIGDLLTLNQPGSRVVGVQKVLSEFLAGAGDRPRLSEAELGRLLLANSLSAADLEEVAKTLGIDLRPGGRLNAAAIRQLIDQIVKAEPGRIEQTYGGQRRFISTAVATGAISADEEFGRLLGLAGDSAISAALGGLDVESQRDQALAALRQLVLDLNTGVLGAGDLGGLTGSEFLELLTDLIGILADPERRVATVTLPTTPGIPGGIETDPIPGVTLPPIPDDFGANVSELVDSGLAQVNLLGSMDESLRGIWDTLRPGPLLELAGAAGGRTAIGPFNVSIAVEGAGDPVTLSHQLSEHLVEAVDQAFQRRYDTERRLRGQATV